MPHPTFDVSTEEIQDYIAGTEYAELPEVHGKNEDWPRLPKETDAVVSNTTGMEDTTATFEENFDQKRDLFGSTAPSWITEPAYAGDGEYDIDLTKPGAEEAFKNDMRGLSEEYEMQHAHIQQTTSYQATRQMKWVNGKWVPTRDPQFKPMPHPAFAPVGVDLMEADVDLGPTGDGGLSSELARFASLTQSHAGAEDDAENPWASPNLALEREGDPLPVEESYPQEDGLTAIGDGNSASTVQSAMPVAQIDTDLREPMMQERLQEAMFDTFTSPGNPDQRHIDGAGALPDIPLDSDMQLQSTGEQTKGWRSANFLKIRTGREEESVARGKIHGMKFGVPVDALDTTRIVDPKTLHTEHENHVFSGLYPRDPSSEMTDFERERLARCLEQHQKKGLPLAYPGVNPFANNAFLRRNKTFRVHVDDQTGRKHDLSAEFRLRQKLKLGHDVAELNRPRYRITDEGGKRHEPFGTTWWKTGKTSAMIVEETCRSEWAPWNSGFVRDGKWKYYGDNPFDATVSVDAQSGFMADGVHRRTALDFSFEVLPPRQYEAYQRAQRLEREVRYQDSLHRQRIKKEHEYKVRMGLVEEDQPSAAESLPNVEVMRVKEPDTQEVEYESMKLDDPEVQAEEYPAYIKPNEDMKSIYGHDPWRTPVRYSAWREFGVHFKDIPEEYLQLRGTGWHDYATIGPIQAENMRLRQKLAYLDSMKWNMRPEHKEKLFKHFRTLVSSNNYLSKQGIDFKSLVGVVGPQRYTVNDTLAREGKRADFLFESRFVKPMSLPDDADVFNWDLTGSSEGGEGTPAPLEASATSPKASTLAKQARQYTTSSAAGGLGGMRMLRAAGRGVARGQRLTRYEQRRGHLSQRRALEEPEIPPHQRLSHRAQYPADVPESWPLKGTAGVAMTVDGVLQRGGAILPGVSQAVKLLHANDVPTIFVSSGYPEWTEEGFAQNLSEALGVTVSKEEVVLGSRSLLSHIGHHIREHPVLVIGPKGCVAQLRNDGFRKAVGVDGIAQSFPHHVPRKWKGVLPPPRPEGPTPTYAIEDILIVGEPDDWQSALQVCVDVLSSKARAGSTDTLRGIHDTEQGCSVMVTDERLVFSGSHEVPRLAAGAFLESLKALYAATNAGRSLTVQSYGRMNPSAQEYVERRLQSVATNMGHEGPMTHIYSVTDNLHHDCAAVGAYRDTNHSKWWSVLLGSGVTNDDGNRVVGVRTRMELVEAQQAAVRSYADGERLRFYLNDRRADAAYEALPLFVSELLNTPYLPSSEEVKASTA
eukprot:TRINITY_DN31992_c0_g1_i1.p1 TRINITY_DN31992_c0_g1~~TRINITY_DN31992_c0_g1_i1.p1  ORF type:complete len:1377 (+),score=380.48 TRINITY_DN31992_c0_g1_i1:329-4132(+)